MYCSRSATEVELENLAQLYEDEFGYFQEHLREAQAFLSIGDAKFEGDRVAQVAAMTTVCQAIQNLDAAIWSR